MLKAPVLFIAAAAVAGFMLAQDEATLQPFMKSFGPAAAAIRNAPDSAAAKGDAQKMADTFSKVGAFFKTKGMADAVEFAKGGADAAQAIADGGDKAANLPKVMGACMSCHTAHREGSPGSFKLK